LKKACKAGSFGGVGWGAARSRMDVQYSDSFPSFSVCKEGQTPKEQVAAQKDECD